MRTRYTLINMLVNIGGQFLTILLSFISRMVFIRCLSAAYLGVNGLFTDVLSILNFAELGIGTAMVFSMYEPAARADTQTVTADEPVQVDVPGGGGIGAAVRAGAAAISAAPHQGRRGH